MIIIINANTVTWNFLRLTKYLMRLMTRIAVLWAVDSLKTPVKIHFSVLLLVLRCCGWHMPV